ncbi:MAG: hypothetical protein AAGA66_11935 [Bacteroidota bacterium]
MKKITLFLLIGPFLILSCDDSGNGSFSLGPGEGVQAISGSTTGFAVVDDYLYTLNGTGLTVFRISSDSPTKVREITITETAETIFQYQNNLLIGTQGGMLIYNIDSRSNPTFLSSVFHQTACDPVIAKDDIAYVTIRTGLVCNTNRIDLNRLIVVDIEDVEAPVELTSLSMQNPRGLTISGNNLYVCEGKFGLKQFDISDKTNPMIEKSYANIPSNDVIALGSTLIVTSDEGISQFTIRNDELELLSSFR